MRRLAALISVIALLGGCALAGRSPAPSVTLQESLPASPSSTSAPSASPIATPVPLPSVPTGVEGTIAYVSGVEDPQIFLLDVASGEIRQLTHLRPEDAELTGLGTGLRPAITCGFGPYSLSWRPDGSMLAFTYGSCETVIYTVELDGTLHRIGEGRSPNWSPDGTRLVFGTNVPYAPCGVDCLDPSLGPWEILMADPMGITAPVPLTANGGTFTASMPTYSPDGTRIAFSGPSSTFDPTGGWSDGSPAESCW
jgi:Tol biopolymer transport system component